MKAAMVSSIVAGCLAGVLSAVVSSRLVASERHAEAQTRRVESSPAPSTNAGPPFAATLPSIAPPPASAAPAAIAEPVMEPMPDLAVAQKQQVEIHQKRLEAHHRDPVDRGWAPKAKADFATDLEGLEKKLDLHVEEVDCRTTSCTARVTFGSYAAARERVKALFEHPFARSSECGTEITLAEPTGDGKYGTEVYFDCTDGRAK